MRTLYYYKASIINDQLSKGAYCGAKTHSTSFPSRHKSITECEWRNGYLSQSRLNPAKKWASVLLGRPLKWHNTKILFWTSLNISYPSHWGSPPPWATMRPRCMMWGCPGGIHLKRRVQQLLRFRSGLRPL